MSAKLGNLHYRIYSVESGEIKPDVDTALKHLPGKSVNVGIDHSSKTKKFQAPGDFHGPSVSLPGTLLKIEIRLPRFLLRIF